MIERAGSENVGAAGLLSPREIQVLRLRATGMTNDRVARLLGISPQTVKNQQSAIYSALGVDNLVGAMWVMGWVKLS